MNGVVAWDGMLGWLASTATRVQEWFGTPDRALAILLGTAALLLALAWLLRRPRRTVGFRVVRRALLTANEIEFLERLETAFPEYRIFCQVSMGALMAPDVPGGSGDYLAIRGRFAQKVVDYVLLDGALEVVALVELDDRTHRVDRDADRDAMTASAGYVTLRYQSRAKPEPAELRAELRRLHAALAR